MAIIRTAAMGMAIIRMAIIGLIRPTAIILGLRTIGPTDTGITATTKSIITIGTKLM
jgi:hypothetical protein